MNYEQKNPQSIKFLFNNIAKNYDIMNILMSFGMQSFIKKIAVKNALKKLNHTPQNILDLCSGTGDIAILFQKYCPYCEITGVDFSKEMISKAKEKNKNITFIEADITDTNSIPQMEYDICFISFGLRNLPDIDTFLENIKPFIKNGGILSILDLGKPNIFFKPYFFLHYNIFIPLIAKLFNKDISPYKYFTESSKTYPQQSEIINKLKTHGYVETKNHNFAFGIISQQLAKRI